MTGASRNRSGPRQHPRTPRSPHALGPAGTGTTTLLNLRELHRSDLLAYSNDHSRRTERARGLMLRNLQGSERLLNVLASLISLTFALAALGAWLANHPLLAALLFSFAVGGALGFASVIVANRQWPLLLPADLVLGYMFESVSVYYDARRPTKHVMQNRVTISATRPDVTHLENQVLWSGRGITEIEITSEGHHIMGPPRRAGGYWYTYFIFLGRRLAKGESETVSWVIWCRTNDPASVEPFLARQIRSKTRDLTLRVSLPSEASLVRAVCQESRQIDGRVTLSRAPVIDEERRELLWRIERPKVGRTYAIRWQWPQANGVSASLDNNPFLF
jgi:hypothetical protein